MNTNPNLNLSNTEREAILLVNAYGLETAVKVSKNQMKFYQNNPNEWESQNRIYNTLVGMQTKKMVAR
jgi:hypothetical protein